MNGASAQPGPAFVTRECSGTTWGGTVEELELLVNPADIGVGRSQVCLCLLVSARLLVGFLSRDGIGFAQIFPAVGAYFRQL